MLVSFGGQAISYDTIGNPINYLGNTMSWTGRTLDSIVKADGTQISYTYDLDGIRTKKTVNGVTTEYFVSGTTILAQKTGNDVIWFIYDVDGEILGFTYNDTPYYYIKNVHGDVVAIVNSTGLVMGAYTYDPWGKITYCGGTLAEINPIRYRGYYYDNETGLYYLNSRYYDPDTCRFISADGYVSTGQGLLGFNMFAYCGNNPVNRVDFTGQSWGVLEFFKELFTETGKAMGDMAPAYAGCGGAALADGPLPFGDAACLFGALALTLTALGIGFSQTIQAPPTSSSSSSSNSTTQTKTSVEDIALSLPKNERIPRIYYGASTYGGFQIITGPMSEMDAVVWGYQKSSLYSTFGLYTPLEADAFHMAVKLGYGWPVGPEVHYNNKRPGIYYMHYHPYMRYFNNNSFHLWYGMPIYG